MFKYISAGLTVSLVIVVGLFYWYYANSQDTIKTLNENNARLETAIAINEQTIEQLQNDYSRIQEITNETNRLLAETRIQNRQLVDRLARHDLGALAEQRPGLVQPRINNATANALRCFELLTGAPLTDQERNATNAREFNSECPWLFDSIRP
jgi:hypothetical protein